MRTVGQIAKVGKELTRFLVLFVGCFRSQPGFVLGGIYVQGLLSDLKRKNVEAIALAFDTSPRTLQRLLQSVKWDEAAVRDICQQLVARHHAHPDAIGCIDESGTAKSGKHTVGAARQWLGSCGKVDNGVVGVHLSYSAPGFQCLLDSQLYLPEEWAQDKERRKKTTSPTTWCSAPNRRSPWTWWTGRWPTAFGCRPGRLMNCMAAMRRFWTGWKSAGNGSWPRCRRIFTVG